MRVSLRASLALACLLAGGMLPFPALAQAAAPLEYSFPHTPAGWSPEGSWVAHSSPVIADLDPARGNGVEMVVTSSDGRVYVLRVSGGQIGLVWSAAVDTVINSSPSVADLDGDGLMEVLVGAGDTRRKAGSGVHVFSHDGSGHRYWATPDVPGFANGVFSTPAVGDVTGDGRPNVVFGAFNHHIYVKDANGADAPGWEGGKLVHDTVWSSPSLADVNGNGRREIVIGSDLGGGAAVFGCPQSARGMVSIFDGSGVFLPGWPKCMDTPIWSSPAVADVDGDGILDVIVGTNNYTEGGVNVGEPWRVHAFAADGRALWSTPLPSGGRIFASPAVGDVTGDGRAEVAIATIEGSGGRVWLLDAASGRVLWGHDDGGDDKCCIFMGSPVMADVSGDGRPDVVAAGGDGAIHAWSGSGERIFRLQLGRTMFNSPAVGDVDADGKNEVVAASAGTGSELTRGKLWVVDTTGSGGAPWPMFRRDPARLGAIGVGRLPGGPPPPETEPQLPPPARLGPARTPSAGAADAPLSPNPPSPPVDDDGEEETGAFQLPLEDETGTGALVWAGLAAALTAVGAGAGLFWVRRRRT